MIIIHTEKPTVYKNGLRITTNDIVVCPTCKDGIAMWRWGYRKRRVRDFQAGSYWIYIQNYYCPKCGHVYWILPDFLIPYRQYDRETIIKIQKGCKDGCGASYLSIYLWKRIYSSWSWASQNLQLL